jgi:hypothetical protein
MGFFFSEYFVFLSNKGKPENFYAFFFCVCSDVRWNDLQGNPTPSKKNAQEIPTPQFDDVESYERDYTRTFAQPSCYIRGRGGLFLISPLEIPFFTLPIILFVYGMFLIMTTRCSKGRYR